MSILKATEEWNDIYNKWCPKSFMFQSKKKLSISVDVPLGGIWVGNFMSIDQF